MDRLAGKFQMKTRTTAGSLLALLLCTGLAWAWGGYFKVDRYLRSNSAVKSAYVAGIVDFVEYQTWMSSQFPGADWNWLVPCASEQLSGQTEVTLSDNFDSYIQKKPEIRELAAASQFVLSVASTCEKAPPYWKAAAAARR